MKKRIIIVGDSFSLGVGADFPPFENLNKYAPPIREAWLDDWYRVTAGYIKDFVLCSNDPKMKENTSIIDRISILSKEFHEWTSMVYTTDYFISWKQNNDSDPSHTDLHSGLMTGREDLADYSLTWSNQLQSMLSDTEVVNLSSGGSSMASVVSALTTYLNMTDDVDEYDTLVFFQAPDPARKHVITTSNVADTLDDNHVVLGEVKGTAFDKKLEYITDYNVATLKTIKPEHMTSDYYDIESHNIMYVEKNLYIGEWFQNIYNMQQICKAHNFSMAWSTSTIPIGDIIHNTKGMYPNVLDIDVRLDRMPHNIDREFVSFTFKQFRLGVGNVDYSKIMSGCRHYTADAQEVFARFMAKSLISNEEFWWQK